MLCEKCIHYEFVKTNASTYCLCSEAFNFKEKLRHNPEAKCNYFKDRAFFNPPLNNNGSYFCETIGSTSKENIQKYIERQKTCQL